MAYLSQVGTVLCPCSKAAVCGHTLVRIGKTRPPKAYMALGPNQYQGAGLSNFPAKCYMDSQGEWTTNEHGVTANAQLEFIVGFANCFLE